VLELIKSPVLIFAATKYLAFFLKFISMVLMAKYLGIEYFAMYSFTVLIIQYLSYSNIGVNYSVSNIISDYKNFDIRTISSYCSNALTVTLGLTIVILIGAFAFNFFLDIFEENEYKLGSYYIVLILIALFKQINNIYINVSRVLHKLVPINIAYLLPVLTDLLLIYFFQGEDLFFALLVGLLISNFVISVFFISRLKLDSIFSFNQSTIKILVQKGFILFLYNLSFYLIFLSFRSVSQITFSIEEFALFSFAFNLSESITLVIGAIGFLLYPKLLNVLSREGGFEIVQEVRLIYVNITTILVMVAIFVAPAIYIFLPEYESSYNIFVVMAIAQILVSNSFAHSIYLIHHKQEKQLIAYGVTSIAIVISCFLLIETFIDQSFVLSGVSLIAGMIFYNLTILKRSYKIHRISYELTNSTKDLFCYRILVPSVILLAGATNNFLNYWVLTLILILYLFLNYTLIKEIFYKVIYLLKNKQSFQIKGKDQ
jgi:O-antigen/teichoic acid export membrane protein